MKNFDISSNKKLSDDELLALGRHMDNSDSEIEITFNWETKKEIIDDHINVFIQFYQLCIKSELSNGIKVKLIFKINGKIELVDERLFAYFLLFRQEFGDNVKINIEHSKKGEEGKYFRTIQQQIQNINLYFKNTYINLYKTQDRNATKKDLAQISRAFLPPVLILKNSLKYRDKIGINGYDYFFTRRKFSIIEELQKIYYGKESIDSVRGITIQDDFRKKISNKITSDNFENIAYSYFILALNSLYFLRTAIQTDYTKGKVLKYFKLSKFNNSHRDKLVDATNEILNRHKVYFFSPMEIYIFSILVIEEKLINKDDFTKEYKEDIKKYVNKYKNKLRYLIEQTKDICYGLHELAKNIVEHSSKGFGVITARRYKKGDTKALNIAKTRGNVFEAWFNDKGIQNSFLELNVIDSGNDSILQKYKDSLEKDIKNIQGHSKEELEKKSENHTEIQKHSKEELRSLEKELQEDLEIIKDYRSINFLDYNKIELSHQIHRAKARLGLLIFSNLTIEQRKGIIKIATTDNKKTVFETDAAYLCEKNITEKEAKKANNKEKLALRPIEESSIGTSYTFDIPINFSEAKDESINADKTSLISGTPTSVLRETLNYKIIKPNEQPEPNDVEKYIIDFREEKFSNCSEKYECVSNVSIEINKITRKYKENSIALLDAAKFKDYYRINDNPSDWIRLLASIQFQNKTPLIILNLDYSTQERIIEINKMYDLIKKKQDDFNRFWSDETGVIFYTKEIYEYENRPEINNKKQKAEIWFNNILLGRSYDDYIALNKKISTYHYNQISINEIDSKSNDNKLSEINPKILFSDKTLINFELLLTEDIPIKDLENTEKQHKSKDNVNLTFFESSVRSLLYLDVYPFTSKHKYTYTNRDIYFNKFKGYKISNSHFKLGSKIHIKDFYYAKRLFYNSFFANRFAFLVAKYLLENSKLEEYKAITLIGYGKYSDLLVSNVRRILGDTLSPKNIINHDIFLDDEKVFKNVKKLHENVIIIIPISSTFSTSGKIKNWLEKTYKKQGKPFPPKYIAKDINILLVADSNYLYFDGNNPKTENNKSDCEIFEEYNEFGWEQFDENDNRIIKLEPQSEKQSTLNEQKYFIPLLTTWQSNHKCCYCFPDNNEEKQEQCLLVTSSNNVTPDIVFGFPIMPNKKENYNPFSYKNYINERQSLIIKGHITRERKPHQYYIRTGAFLKNNKKDIKGWLRGLPFSNTIKDSNRRNIIITPSHTANSGFVNIVNEVVFDETATILQYSDTDDLLENFILFNSSFFVEANLFFVDDIIHSGKTFHEINNYLKQIRLVGDKEIKFKYVICLVKRTNYFHEQAIQQALESQGELYPFSTFYLPSLETKHYEFPPLAKYKLFSELSDSSVTDTMRFHFKELENEVKEFDLNEIGIEPTSKMLHFFNTLVAHYLHQVFEGEVKKQEVIYNKVFKVDDKNYSIDEIIEKKDSFEFLKILYKYLKEEKEMKSFLKNKGECFKNELKNRIVYLCATPPLSYYKALRQFAFDWVLKELKSFENKILDDDGNWLKYMLEYYAFDSDYKTKYSTEYNCYQTFKLYLRLGAELNCNYIFSTNMLKAIHKFMTFLQNGNNKKSTKSQNCENLDKDTKLQNTKTYSVSFKTFYAGIVQQIINKDDAKSSELIRNIYRTTKDLNISLKSRDSFDNHFIDLLRILVLENTSIFTTFIENLYKEPKNDIVIENINFDNYDENIEELEKFVKESVQSSRYKTIKTLLCQYQVCDNIPEDCKQVYKRNLEKDKSNFVGCVDDKLQEAFIKTICTKAILRNDTEKQKKLRIEDKLDIILSFCCEILDVNDGGAYFVSRFKDLHKIEKNITSEDLYTITNKYKSDNNKLKVDLKDNDSLVCKMFQGIKQKDSNLPMSILELLSDDDSGEQYKSTTVNYYHNDKDICIDDCTETRGQQKYHNLLFLRISDIKEENTHKCIIEKILEYLKDRTLSLKDIDIETIRNNSIKAELTLLINKIKKIDSNRTNSKKIEQQNLFKTEDEIEKIKSQLNEIKNKVSYVSKPLAIVCFYNNRIKDNSKQKQKRFDPKRLRLLLLLKKDIQNFIRHNLQNDSFVDFVNGEEKRLEIKAKNMEIENQNKEIKLKNKDLNNAIGNFNHNTVKNAFVLISDISEIDDENIPLKIKAQVNMICSDIIVSDMFNTINQGKKFTCTETLSPKEYEINRLLDKNFIATITEIIKIEFNNGFDINKNFLLKTNGPRVNKGIHKNHFKALVVLLIRNIKKHNRGGLKKQHIYISLSKNEFILSNTYDNLENYDYEEFEKDKRSVEKNNKRRSLSNGITHFSFKNYFEKTLKVKKYDYGFDTKEKTFKVNIKF